MADHITIDDISGLRSVKIGNFFLSTSGKLYISTPNGMVCVAILTNDGSIVNTGRIVTNADVILQGLRCDSVPDGPCIFIDKARGTLASPAAVQSGDQMLYMDLQGYDGSNYQSGATIIAYVDGSPVAGHVIPSRFEFSIGDSTNTKSTILTLRRTTATWAGKFDGYNGLTLAGQGVPAIIYAEQLKSNVTNVSQNISTSDGLYRITIYYGVAQVNAGNATCQSVVTYYQPSATSHTLNGTSLLASGGLGANFSVTYTIFHIGSNNLNIALNFANGGSGGTFDHSITVEKLI